MKVFNQGARAFRVWDVRIEPGKFTEIPEDTKDKPYSKHVEALLKDYPTELVTDSAARKTGRAQSERIAQLEKENAELKAQVAKLTAVAAAGGSPGSSSGDETPTPAGGSTPGGKGKK